MFGKKTEKNLITKYDFLQACCLSFFIINVMKPLKNYKQYCSLVIAMYSLLHSKSSLAAYEENVTGNTIKTVYSTSDR